MYTYNLLIFGHQMSVNKKLNNFISDIDLEFSKKINGKSFEISTPYHGGIVRDETYAIALGTIITDDDNNPNYLSEVRSLKEEDFITDYNKFLSILISEIEEISIDDEYLDDDDRNNLAELKSFLETESPKFYTLEVSS